MHGMFSIIMHGACFQLSCMACLKHIYQARSVTRLLHSILNNDDGGGRSTQSFSRASSPLRNSPGLPALGSDAFGAAHQQPSWDEETQVLALKVGGRVVQG